MLCILGLSPLIVISIILHHSISAAEGKYCISKGESDLCGSACNDCVQESLGKVLLMINSTNDTFVTIDIAAEENEFSDENPIFYIGKDLSITGLGPSKKNIWSGPGGLGFRFSGKLFLKNIHFRLDNVLEASVTVLFRNVEESNAHLEIVGCDFTGHPDQRRLLTIARLLTSTVIINQCRFEQINYYTIIYAVYSYASLLNSVAEKCEFDMMFIGAKSAYRLENNTISQVNFVYFGFNFTRDNDILFLNNTIKSVSISHLIVLLEKNKLSVQDFKISNFFLINEIILASEGSEVEIVRNSYSYFENLGDGYQFLYYINYAVFTITSLSVSHMKALEAYFIYSFDEISLTIKGLHFENITMSRLGNLISLQSRNNLFVTDFSIVNLKSNQAAIQLLSDNSIKFENVKFQNCFLNNKEGLISLSSNNKLFIDSGSFTDVEILPPPLSLESNGGILYLASKNTVEAFFCNFTRISVYFSGGVLLANKENSILLVHTRFEGNWAQYGGACYIGSNNTIQFQETLVIKEIKKSKL